MSKSSISTALDIVTNGERTKYKKISPEVWADHDFALAAVSMDGGALEYVSPDLQNDEDIVIAALKNFKGGNNSTRWVYNGLIKYASPEMQNNENVAAVAMKCDPVNSYEYLSPQMQVKFNDEYVAVTDRIYILGAITQLRAFIESTDPREKFDKKTYNSLTDLLERISSYIDNYKQKQ